MNVALWPDLTVRLGWLVPISGEQASARHQDHGQGQSLHRAHGASLESGSDAGRCLLDSKTPLTAERYIILIRLQMNRLVGWPAVQSLPRTS